MSDRDLLKRLECLDTCAISDSLDSFGLVGVVSDITRRSTTWRVSGRVQTVKLSAGKHTIRALFAKGNHVPYDPAITTEITFNVK